MRAVSTFPQVYVYRGLVDFRKSIDGLSLIVESELQMKPFSGAIFVFMHRRRDRVKLLYWDKTGFALWYKRLEEEKFSWFKIKPSKADAVTISTEELLWLLDGINIWKIQRHQPSNFETFG
jgi:transposase